jgi:hypothetical protein
MRTWIAAAVMVAVAALTTACGNGDPQAQRGELTWRQTYHDSIAISVGEPSGFRSSNEHAAPASTDAWRSVVVLTNNSPNPVPLSALRVGATSDGREAREVIDPNHGCNGFSASSPLMPGQQVALVGCWTGGNEPRSVTFTLLDSLRSVTFSD